MATDSRLTAEQIAALAPGDSVTIESGAEFARLRYTTGTVVRMGATHVVVRVEGPRGGTFIERYSLRYGLRDGGGRAELVRADGTPQQNRRNTQHIDLLYRQWHRRPGDFEALRELRDAISEYLDEALVP